MSSMSLNVKELVVRNLMSNMEEVISEVVRACGERYGFSSEEAMRELNVKMNLSSEMSSKSAKSSSKAVKSSEIKLKSKYPLPFNGLCKDSCCKGLRQNIGLYTQCEVKVKSGIRYCKVCQSQADKNENGKPDYGTIEDRLAVDILEYTDPKGKKVSPYTKIMKKLKITREDVELEANKLNIIINEMHFETTDVETKRGRPKTEKIAKEPTGPKGRPKKSKKVLEIEGDETDLFASLVASANVEESDKEEQEEEEAEEAKAAKKEVERLEKEAKKEADRLEKEAKKEADRLEKEAKKEAERLEKEAKKEADRLEKEAKKEAERLEKEAKEAKKEADRLEKEAKKEAERLEKEAKAAAASASKKEPKKEKKAKAVIEEEEEEEAEVVKKIVYEDKKYLKSKKSGIIYDYKEYAENGEQVVVGKWNDSKNIIEFTKNDKDEEEEEEYEE
jgi:cell division septum initiation protein DivIVA